VRLIHAIIRATVDGNGSLSARRFDRIHLVRRFKLSRHPSHRLAYAGVPPANAIASGTIRG
jgi:hypothetical protein